MNSFASYEWITVFIVEIYIYFNPDKWMWEGFFVGIGVFYVEFYMEVRLLFIEQFWKKNN